MHDSRTFLRFVAGGLASLLVSSCAVGPDFQSPAAPQTTSYTQSPLHKTTSTAAAGKAGKAQYFMTAEDIPAEWWHLFRSQELNDLILAGLENSPNLAAAQAALHQAQEMLTAQIGTSYYPNFTAQVGGQRERFAGSSFGNTIPTSIFNVFNATASVSYMLDVFGGQRREVEAVRAQVDYQQYQLMASYLTLTTNIVTTAVTVASLEAQIKATRELIKAFDDQLVIIEKQFRLGGVARTNVLTQQTLLSQTIATLPPLEKSLAQNQHALAVLVGELPNKRFPIIDLNSLTLPERLPVSLPSKLVQQRPDIQASTALLHVASAQVGVQTANLFPQITLTGDYGGNSSVPATLLSGGNRVWDYGGQINQPIFQGGALLANRRAAIAAFEQSEAQYKQTVLQAFQNVADTLRALETDAKALHAQQAAETAAHRSLVIAQQQYRLGGVSYLQLLNAQQQYQQTLIARIQAQAMRYNDTAALFQALGGGWWNLSSEAAGKLQGCGGKNAG